jgi:hypothetical protein
LGVHFPASRRPVVAWLRVEGDGTRHLPESELQHHNQRHHGRSFGRQPVSQTDPGNAALYFETPRFSARISYNYRSEAFGILNLGSQIVTDAYHQVDATASWNFTPGLSVYANAVNIFNEIPAAPQESRLAARRLGWRAALRTILCFCVSAVLRGAREWQYGQRAHALCTVDEHTFYIRSRGRAGVKHNIVSLEELGSPIGVMQIHDDIRGIQQHNEMLREISQRIDAKGVLREAN